MREQRVTGSSAETTVTGRQTRGKRQAECPLWCSGQWAGRLGAGPGTAGAGAGACAGIRVQ